MELDAVEDIIFIVGGILCLYNMFGIMTQCVLSCIFKMYHTNFRMVYLNHLLALALISYGYFVSIIIYSLGAPDVHNYALEASEVAALYGNYMMRTIYTAFFVERGMASLLKMAYYSARYYAVGFLILVLVHVSTLMLMFMAFFANANVTTLIQACFMILLDIIALICIVGMAQLKKHLIKLSTEPSIELTDRHCIHDNLRALNSILTVAAYAGIADLVTSIVNLVLALSKFAIYRAIIFNLMMNICVALAVTVALKSAGFRSRVGHVMPWTVSMTNGVDIEPVGGLPSVNQESSIVGGLFLEQGRREGH
uniref:Serpentine receptor class gamma n=1 Tax=Panagrellus redivivus TaxID=6233 RepID=A0A7E4W911_PANRE